MPKTVEKNRIVINPKVMGGKPVIKGTRIPVYIILEYIESGHSIKDIVEDYPDLKKEDVKAALRYATDVLGGEEVKAKKGA